MESLDTGDKIRVALVTAVALAALVAFWVRAWPWVMDDAYISLRYVANACQGHGLVFNLGQRVEGVTNIGWILVLLPFAKLLGPVMAAKLLSAVFLGLTFLGMAWLVVRLRRMLGERLPASWQLLVVAPPVLLAASQLELMFFSAVGMETALYAFLLVACALALAYRSSLVVPATASAFLFNVHPEAVLIWPVMELILLFTGKRAKAKNLLAANATYLAVLAAGTLGRLLYYGQIFPNTFAAKAPAVSKVIHSTARLLSGHGNLVPSLLGGVVAFALVGVAVAVLFSVSDTVACFLASSYIVGVGFAAFAGPDWTGLARYFAPFVPVTLILWSLGLVFVSGWLTAYLKGRSLRWVSTCLVLIFLLTGGLFGSRLVALVSRKAVNRYPGYVMTGTPLIGPSKWIASHLPKNAVLATRRIGAVSYYSDLDIFDWKWGLTDPDVAQWPSEVTISSLVEDVKFAQLWHRRAPQYVLEDDDIVSHLCQHGAGTSESLRLCGWTYHLLKRFSLGVHREWCLYALTKTGQPVSSTELTGSPKM